MLEQLTGLPDGVLGFTAVGELHSDDYKDVLLPAIEQKLSAGEKVRVHLTQLFGWMTPGELKHFPLSDRADAIEWAAS